MRALYHGVQAETLDAPPAIATPRVEGAMVAGLFHGVEDVAVVDMVPSPATVSYVNSRARYVVDGTVPNGDRSCDVDLNRSSLFFDLARLVNQRIFNEALCRVVRRTRSGSKIEIPDAQSIVVAVQWISHRLPLADKRDSVGSGASDVAARNANPAVVSTHKNPIPTELIEKTIVHVTVFGAGEEQGAATIDPPVTAEKRFPSYHKRPGSMLERKSTQLDPFHWRALASAKLHQMFQAHGLDNRVFEIQPCGRINIQD